jgi:RNA polymerase sigma factor (sigma-70 family)
VGVERQLPAISTEHVHLPLYPRQYRSISFPVFPSAAIYLFRMTTMTDHDLLQRYAETGAQEAFADLVSHHIDWIYSASLRLVRRTDLAEDVTQAVFIILSQRAKNVPGQALNRWLFKVARYCASDILRQENRREKRERQAAIMNSQTRESGHESTWEDISPVLEQSVAELNAADRDAVLLRFYQQKSLSEVGVALGVSEDAARKRVAKAVERLRSRLTSHGVIAPATGTAMTILAEQSTHAAPAGLAAACAAKSGAAALQIAANVNHMLVAIKVKFAVIAAIALLLLPAATWMGAQLWRTSHPMPTTPAVQAAPAVAQNIAQQDTQPGPATGNAPPPTAMSVDDSAITPFYNSLTQLIVSLNFSLIDIDALKAEEAKAFALYLDQTDPRLPQAKEMANQFNRQITGAAKAILPSHASHFYAMIAMGRPGNAAGFFVLPIVEDGDTVPFDRFMGQPPTPTPDGKTRLYCAKPMAKTLILKMPLAQKRPEMGPALSDGPDAAVRLVINSTMFDEMRKVISTPKTLGLGQMSEPQWQKVKWIRMSIDAPPSLSGTIVIECNDEAAAGALADLLTKQFAALHATAADPVKKDPASARIAQLVGDLKPEVAGSQVTLDLDQAIMDPILVDWFVNVLEHPRTSGRPQPAKRTGTEPGM